MALPAITELMIKAKANEESFRRGQAYYERGAVVSLHRRGPVLQAQVEGRRFAPYRVRITFDEGGVTDAICDCPDDRPGWCKHIVATLLHCLHQPQTIQQRPTYADLLADADREVLERLLLSLAQADPDVAEQIEDRLDPYRAAPEEAGPSQKGSVRRTPVDPTPVRREVVRILHSVDYSSGAEAYWQVSGAAAQVRYLVQDAQEFIEAGDGRNAMALLEAITDEYIAGWVDLDDSNGEASAFFKELGQAWTEACLVTNFSGAERRRWARRLTDWQSEIDPYGVDEGFDAAQAALLQGWDYPPLQKVLQGEESPTGVWEGEPPWFADDLTLARLNVLARQGRYEAYLNLARAEGRLDLYAQMLVAMGRVDEAVDAGLQHLDDPSQFLALARALRERGETEAALRVAHRGLSAPGYKHALALWLRDLAEGLGERAIALDAAVVAFRTTPGMEDYRRVQALAGPRWTELREQLLSFLRQTSDRFPSGAVDIFLHEGLMDDAIAAVRRGAGYDTLARVCDAVVKHRPKWVIETARRQAERIIEPGEARYYHHAVNWLARVRAGYQALGREEEWQAYLGDIRARHGRKYKLMGMLRELDRD